MNTISTKLRGSIKNIQGLQYFNRGVSKLENHISKENPDIVLLEYGGNDCAFNWDEVADNPDANHLPNRNRLFETALQETIRC